MVYPNRPTDSPEFSPWVYSNAQPQSRISPFRDSEAVNPACALLFTKCPARSGCVIIRFLSPYSYFSSSRVLHSNERGSLFSTNARSCSYRCVFLHPANTCLCIYKCASVHLQTRVCKPLTYVVEKSCFASFCKSTTCADVAVRAYFQNIKSAREILRESGLGFCRKPCLLSERCLFRPSSRLHLLGLCAWIVK